MMVLLAMPIAVELLVWMGDFGCGHPILMRVCQMGTISLVQMKRLVSFALAADDMTNLMI